MSANVILLFPASSDNSTALGAGLEKPSESIAVHVDAQMITRLDALIPRFSKPGHKATRSDVVRALLLTGLDAAEAIEADEAGPKSGVRSSLV